MVERGGHLTLALNGNCQGDSDKEGHLILAINGECSGDSDELRRSD